MEDRRTDTVPSTSICQRSACPCLPGGPPEVACTGQTQILVQEEIKRVKRSRGDKTREHLELLLPHSTWHFVSHFVYSFAMYDASKHQHIGMHTMYQAASIHQRLFVCRLQQSAISERICETSEKLETHGVLQ